jgi:glyoxylase-like metal-dependent hydrolase (beta-lactamase superfamily II)
MEYYEVSDSVVMAKHQYGCNITCLATQEGLYFMDSGLSTELARTFRQDMEKKFSRKTLALLITHPHIDHFWGMAAFSDVQVVAAETGKNLWKKQLSIKFNDQVIDSYTRIFPKFRESHKTAKPFMPTVLFKDQTVLGTGKNKLIFTNTGGHTVCSSSVYFPKEHVLVSGDLIQVDQYPYFGDPGNDMDAWLHAFEQWENMPIDKICPGHGPPVDKSYITLMKGYFTEMVSVLQKLKKGNVAVKEVIRHPDLPKGYWGDDVKRPVWFDYCIAALYQKL